MRGMKKWPEYSLRAAAKQDIAEIFDFSIGHWSTDIANAYIRDIYSMMDLVAERPKIGRLYTTSKGKKVRRFIVNSHLIVYREADGGVVILRILHQSMNPDQHI